ncbi:hypothetical protein D0T66_07530 [Dysgonomonas sp. 25]|nr:hypothetical protein [Dysgonomonas sp. 25]
MITLLPMLLSSCISAEETNYLQTINLPYQKQEYKEYKLQTGDQISCAIYTHNKEFSQIFNRVIGTSEQSSNIPYLIHLNGKILLPYFGEIEVAGLTITEAEDKIQAFMRDAITDVEVNIQLVNNYYYVLSDQGQRRGRHDIYKENMTIFQALAQVGSQSYGDNSFDLRKVTIVRRDADGNTIQKSFDLRSKDVIESEFYYIYPNDMLYFPTSSKSFFNITSLSSLVNTILMPITFLIMVSRVSFK